MRLVILQPSYLPWLGYFDQMFKSDVFVIYDDVQFDKHGWRNRNRIKTAQGVQWLTVPVLTKGRNFPLNCDVEINNTAAWQDKHLKSLKQNYVQAPWFDKSFAAFEAILQRPFRFLIDLNLELISAIKNNLRLTTHICRASELSVPRSGKTERLIEICQKFGADTFLEGEAGQNYIDEALFAQHGIRLEYQRYQHPIYQQLHGEFVPYLSIVDLLFNHGSGSLEILTNKKENS
jgi:hypothetical protein